MSLDFSRTLTLSFLMCLFLRWLKQICRKNTHRLSEKVTAVKRETYSATLLGENYAIRHAIHTMSLSNSFVLVSCITRLRFAFGFMERWLDTSTEKIYKGIMLRKTVDIIVRGTGTKLFSKWVAPEFCGSFRATDRFGTVLAMSAPAGPIMLFHLRQVSQVLFRTSALPKLCCG